MKQIVLFLLPFLLTLFSMGHSFADEVTVKPNEQLQEIIDLFISDAHQDALTRFELHENDLVTSVRELRDSETYMLLGRAYFYAEKDAKALEAFEATLQLDSSQSDAHFFAGLIHRFVDDLDGAEKSFQSAISANSEDEKYFVELGRTLEMKDDQASASTAYKNALALNETNFDANFNLATIYANEGDTVLTEKHYLAAVEQEPTDLDSHYNLGQLYQTTKKHRLAIKRFETVMELNPNDWRAIAKLVQENEAVKNYAARDAAIESIYEVWRTNVNEDLSEQGFYIREQLESEAGKIFALEYFELKGERARKFVFKLQDEQTGELKFDVSLGSYDHTTNISRELGEIGGDERIYHLDGYSPDGSHYTYAFFDSIPTYEAAKDLALKALAGRQKSISSTVIQK